MQNRMRASLIIFSLVGLAGCTLGSSRRLELAPGDTDIVGGATAQATDPFTQMVVGIHNSKFGTVCSGVIMSVQFVLTAAHCAADSDPADLHVEFGLQMDQGHTPIQGVNLIRFSPLWDPDVDKEKNTGDMALLRFSGGLPPGYRAALPLTDKSQLKNGQSVLLTGYGSTDGKVNTGIGTLRSVQEKIKDVDYSPSEFLISQTDGSGACRADSGGAAFVTIDSKQYLFSIAQEPSSPDDDSCASDTVYTSVPYFENSWIAVEIKSLSAN